MRMTSKTKGTYLLLECTLCWTYSVLWYFFLHDGSPNGDRLQRRCSCPFDYLPWLPHVLYIVHATIPLDSHSNTNPNLKQESMLKVETVNRSSLMKMLHILHILPRSLLSLAGLGRERSLFASLCRWCCGVGLALFCSWLDWGQCNLHSAMCLVKCAKFNVHSAKCIVQSA